MKNVLPPPKLLPFPMQTKHVRCISFAHFARQLHLLCAVCTSVLGFAWCSRRRVPMDKPLQKGDRTLVLEDALVPAYSLSVNGVPRAETGTTCAERQRVAFSTCSRGFVLVFFSFSHADHVIPQAAHVTSGWRTRDLDAMLDNNLERTAVVAVRVQIWYRQHTRFSAPSSANGVLESAYRAYVEIRDVRVGQSLRYHRDTCRSRTLHCTCVAR